MALPKKKKKIVTDIGAAVQKAAGQEKTEPKSKPANKNNKMTPAVTAAKAGRPSPRSGKVERMTLLLNENTAERLTIAFATEQVRRRKLGDKVDKSLLIEEAIVKWLDDKGF